MLLPRACGHFWKEQIHLLLPNQTRISTECWSGSGAGQSVSPDISMELNSGVSPAGCNHPVLLRKRTVRLTSLWCSEEPPYPFPILFFYMQSCLVVHDLSLVVSVSMMGFCALQGDGFAKHDTSLCRVFAGIVVHLCAVFAVQLWQLLLFWKKPRKEARRSRHLSPSLASLCPCWCREARMVWIWL